MDYFNYVDGVLCVEDVLLFCIVVEVGMLVYVYLVVMLIWYFKLFQMVLDWIDYLVCFVVKLNSNLVVLKLLGDLGVGMDIVLVGEYVWVKVVGVLGECIVFFGVGKIVFEMCMVLEGGICQFNVEFEFELELLLQVVVLLGVVVFVVVWVNFDVDVKMYEKIVMGKLENKFGIFIVKVCVVYVCVVVLLGIKVVGIDMYIGSQLIDLEFYCVVYVKMVDLICVLCVDGYDICCLDMGGGFGIFYCCDNSVLFLFIEYGQVICEVVGDLGCEIEIELGCNILGNVGVLLLSVIYLKEGEGWDFLIFDVVMNDLIWFVMYVVYYDIVLVIEVVLGVVVVFYDVVGLVCEMGDIFEKVVQLFDFVVGDLVVLCLVGVYGVVMVLEYNFCLLVFEVLVQGD